MLVRYGSIDKLPSALPIFPLKGAILLPRAELPLNIFEPRYLRLIEDALKGERMIGIIQPLGEGGSTGSPMSRAAEIAGVGCAGRVTSFQELADGRILIVLTGVARFQPVSELATTTPYRICKVDFEPFACDLERGVGEDEVDRERLLATLRRFRAARQATADWKRIEETATEQLVNWLSLASPFEGPEKQALLEAQTLKARAEMLITLAEMDLASGPGTPGNRLQ
jgi:Lon protease-like protein